MKRIKKEKERENSTKDYAVYYQIKLFNIKMSLVVVVFALTFMAINAFMEAIRLVIK